MNKEGYNQFTDMWQANARLALDTITMKSTDGIPCWMINDMQWSHIEELSGHPKGSYPDEPVRVYRAFQLAMGACYIDQWIPENPLSINEKGYGEETEHTATTGAKEVVCNGIRIDSPEAVVEHMENFLFPQWQKRYQYLETHADEVIQKLIAREVKDQKLFGMNMLKGPYAGFCSFPHFARSIQPFLDAGIRIIWHCDGNLMDMVPRLLECGLGGFQGFQYEDGMDYERICQMKTRDGEDLFIIGGVSVTTTLPHGTPADVRREIDWLVEKGPKVGLMLGCSSSVAPGVPIENMKALAEGCAYYRTRWTAAVRGR